MATPVIKAGRFSAGADLVCGENVVVDVAEEVVVGARCVLPDNAHLSGRRVTIGDDFYGYSWDWRRLDVGRGRRDDEHAVCQIGDRCTVHDNRIDLARGVTIGDDVGLSPEAVIYTHYYWMSPLDGFPQRYAGVTIGCEVLVGCRAVILPGVRVGFRAVIGAGAVVRTDVEDMLVYAGNPAVHVSTVTPMPVALRRMAAFEMVTSYCREVAYRTRSPGFVPAHRYDYPILEMYGVRIDLEQCILTGDESFASDDLRDFLFKHGVRIYTSRPFKKLGMKSP